MMRYFYVIFLAIFITLQAGCGAAHRAQADAAVDKMLAASESLLVEFKTVVDDQTARNKLETLNQRYDDLVASVSTLEEAQKNSYVTGGGLSDVNSKVDQHRKKFGNGFQAHRKSLPDSTLAILKPFFEKMKNGPIK